jgi:hypothetical protein
MNTRLHSFHIPVLGLAFSIDTPVKVSKYGISSVVSIVDDVLIEDVRSYYSGLYGYPYTPIHKDEPDYRARRITAYLNLLDTIVKQQVEDLKSSSLEEESDLTRYIDLLNDTSPVKHLYNLYFGCDDEDEKSALATRIRESITPGAINVNIMTKLDKANAAPDGTPLPGEYSDALAALRGFVNSTVKSSVVFSAGFNPRLYAYIASFPEFLPNAKGRFSKSVILKVSDFRSAYVQGKYLAKKGIWISEFRIESGLNCGGHAFPTEGYLLGPILEEFKTKRDALRDELFKLCQDCWSTKDFKYPEQPPRQKLSVQGGIGTANEHKFLLDYYEVDSAGWGTPFLLVPEATTVDEDTLNKLIDATEKDLYLSEASPLGIPFNNLRNTASEQQIKKRLKMGRPGSPCLRKFLVSNTEFTKEPVCTASRQYQHDKLLAVNATDEPKPEILESIVAKACLCEDLSAPAYLNKGLKQKIGSRTAVCPGPNMAYFSGKFSLKQMVDHIYGRTNLLNETYRPNMFINELKMYVDYLSREINKQSGVITTAWFQHIASFKINIRSGIEYYKSLIPQIDCETVEYLKRMKADLQQLENRLSALLIPEELVVA